MQTDVHFRKGSSHNIYEDYGLNTDNLIIISDGCSSSEHSDVASRVISHVCKNMLQDDVLNSYDLLAAKILVEIKYIAKSMNLNDLLATLIVSFIYNEDVYTYVYGDGYVVIKNRNIDCNIYKIDFLNNTPNYLWYLSNRDYYNVDDCDVQINGKLFPRNHPITFVNPIKDLEYIAIFTDGVSSFVPTKPKEDSIFGNKITDLISISELTNFKTTKGRFVVRRLNRFLQQTKDNGFIHEDDITCAVMHFGDL